MSRRDTVTLQVRARNLMARGLRRAGRMLGGFARSARRMARNLAIGFAAATAAAITFGIKAVQAYAKQQKAERELTAALNAHGQAGEDLLPIYKRIASRIQDATGTADEFTLSVMAQMRQLGVQAHQLEEAAKGHVALMHAGMGSDTATRALSAAMQGNYSLLTRYIPAIREAGTEEERAAILQGFLTRNYEAAQEELKTLSGRWREFRGRVGDAMENIGEAISKMGAIQSLMKAASEAVVRFGQSIRDWIDSERFERMRDAIHDILSAMSRGTGEQRIELLKAGGRVIVAAFAVAAERAVAVLAEGAVRVGRVIGEVAKRALEGDLFEKFHGRGAREAMRRIDRSPELRQQFIVADQDAQAEMIGQVRDRIRLEKILESAGLKTLDAVEGQSAAMVTLRASYEGLVNLANDINETQGERSSLEEEIKGTILDQVSLEELRDKARMNALRRREAAEKKANKAQKEAERLEKRRNGLLERRARILENIGRQAQVARLDEQIKKVEQRVRDIMFRDVPEAINERARAFMERRGQAHEVREADAATKKEWAELRRKLGEADKWGRPVRREDRERFRELELFRRALLEEQAAEGEVKALEEKRERIQDDQLRELQGINEKMAEVRHDLQTNLRAAGG